MMISSKIDRTDRMETELKEENPREGSCDQLQAMEVTDTRNTLRKVLVNCDRLQAVKDVYENLSRNRLGSYPKVVFTWTK